MWSRGTTMKQKILWHLNDQRCEDISLLKKTWWRPLRYIFDEIVDGLMVEKDLVRTTWINIWWNSWWLKKTWWGQLRGTRSRAWFCQTCLQVLPQPVNVLGRQDLLKKKAFSISTLLVSFLLLVLNSVTVVRGHP